MSRSEASYCDTYGVVTEIMVQGSSMQAAGSTSMVWLEVRGLSKRGCGVDLAIICTGISFKNSLNSLDLCQADGGGKDRRWLHLFPQTSPDRRKIKSAAAAHHASQPDHDPTL